MNHTTFQLTQLLKHKPIQIANKLLDIYGENAVDVAKRYLPESYEQAEKRAEIKITERNN